MIQVDMIREVQELKLAGYTPKEVHEELRKRHTKVPTIRTVRKYYNMDCVPEDNHANLGRGYGDAFTGCNGDASPLPLKCNYTSLK